MAGIYLHVPFCSSRCIYCDFYSTTSAPAWRDAYVEALCAELRLRRDELAAEEVQTIYWGGGTPSLLSADQLQRVMAVIRQHYRIAPDAEITLESNPDDVTLEGAQAWRALGFNRVSLGIQSFHDDILRTLRRRHTAAGARSAVAHLQQAGFGNITVDLIYGLPGQTLGRWQEDLDQVAQLGVQHLSAYALSYEEGTALTKMRDAGTVVETDEETLRQMYLQLIERTRALGFEHYEISNFSLPGFASRHNSSYWQGVPYLGVGPGAHSFDGKQCRRANQPDLKAYIAAAEAGEAVPAQVEELDETEMFEEYLLTSMRTAKGADLAYVTARFGEARQQALMRLAQRFLKQGSLQLVDGHLQLTVDGIFISDYVLSDLIAAVDF